MKVPRTLYVVVSDASVVQPNCVTAYPSLKLAKSERDNLIATQAFGCTDWRVVTFNKRRERP